MRITIIGLPGSGKSTLASAISEKLHIPHIHIDRFWFESGGRQNSDNTPNLEQVRASMRDKTISAISGESWVSDGFYSQLQPEIAQRADVVIFLEVPLWRRLLNHTKRTIFRMHRHPELSFWDDIKFFSEVVRRTFTKKAKLENFLKKYKDKVVILKSRKELDEYVVDLLASTSKK
jgi:adenylate kinase family enzyme